MPSFLDATCEEFCRRVRSRFGTGPCLSVPAYRCLCRSGPEALQRETALSAAPDLHQALVQRSAAAALHIAARVPEDGGLEKFCFTLADGTRIESVLVPMPRHQTLCISSQVGCARGCRMCATAAMGCVRNLTAAEIVGQVYTVRIALGLPISNVVFMGMGEPGDNIDNVLQAIAVLRDQRGFNIAPRRITVSTAGHAEAIERLAALPGPRPNLAISINAPDDTLRSSLMPINRSFPLARLRTALETFPLRRGGLFLVQYVLIRDVNDTACHAARLADFLAGLPVRVNVIACNPVPGTACSPPDEAVMLQFCRALASQGIFVRRRTGRGARVRGGCGQLGAAATLNLKPRSTAEGPPCPD